MDTQGKFARIWAWRWRLAAGGAVLAGAGYLLYGFAVGPTVEVAQVVRREVIETVVASGRVATPYRVDVGSQVVGTVAEVPVAEGQNVKAGQMLVALDSREARASAKQAQVAVAQAQAQLQQLQELQLPVASHALRQALANLTDARAQFERTSNLFQEGFVSSSALDDARRNLDVAQAQFDSAGKQVETAQPAGSDYVVALRALDQAKAGLQEAQARLAYTTIRAPAAGTLIARDDVVQPGKVLMVLSPSGETQVERHRDVLAVPAIAVRDASGPSPWVLKVKTGRASVQMVKLGLRGETGVEIREGLEPGDVVVAVAMTRVKPGQRLRPVRND